MPDGMLARFRQHLDLGRGRDMEEQVQELHEDVDESTLRVDCRSGTCEVRLEERIWWTWSTKQSWTLREGQNVRATEAVDSAFFDGDHRLSVVATGERTSVEVDFTSRARG